MRPHNKNPLQLPLPDHSSAATCDLDQILASAFFPWMMSGQAREEKMGYHEGMTVSLPGPTV
jgi:hypothetical protein